MIFPTTRSVVAVSLVACAGALMLVPAPAGNHDLLLALITGLLGWLSPSPTRSSDQPPPPQSVA